MKNKDSRETPLDPELANALHRLSEEGLEPDRDLWPALERKMRSPSPVTRHGFLRAAAALVILAVLAGALWRMTSNPASDWITNLASSRTPAQIPAAGSDDLRNTFSRYMSDRQQVLSIIAEQLDDYPPELRGEIRDSIEQIEQAMREIEASIATAPFEPATEARLTDLYEMELRLLGVVRDRLQGSVSRGAIDS